MTKRKRQNGIWPRLDELIPTLNAAEQKLIYSEMRHNAVANVDFYLLILLASGIAYFGLQQNSSVVIIGAMLVAPLMSPMSVQTVAMMVISHRCFLVIALLLPLI